MQYEEHYGGLYLSESRVRGGRGEGRERVDISFTDVNPQELGAAHSLHSSTVNGQWGFRSGDSPEINNNLLGLLDVHEEVGCYLYTTWPVG